MKDYREMVLKEYLKRRGKDRSYTQKKFASDLGITYALLHKVLIGEKGLSKLNAFLVGKALGLGQSEAKEFRFLVSAQSGRSRHERTLAKQWLRMRSSKSEANFRHKSKEKLKET